MTPVKVDASPVAPDSSASRGGWGRDLLLLALVLAAWFGAFLGSRPLNNPDEGRYTEIPREMVATGDYVTPRLDGVKYFEKPPLVYWLSALTFKTVGAVTGTNGVNEWTARFWAAAFAWLGGLMTYAAGRALYGRAAGWWAAIVLSTSLLYYGLGRIILLDMVVGVTMAGALFAFLLGVREASTSRRRRLFLAFYVFMALAVLTKGLIGFLLPCLVAFVWLLVFNQWRALRPCYPVVGALVLLAIAAPWHVLVALHNPSADGTVWPGYARGLALHAAGKDPGWTWFYFVNEHYLRFTTKDHGRYEPAWFFIPVFIAGLFPWCVFAWQAACRNLKDGWRGRKDELAAWFLVLWVVLIIAFFSKSDSKLVPYLSPVFPAAAVLIGRYLADAWKSHRAGAWESNGARGFRAGLWVFAGLMAAGAVAVAMAPLPAKQAFLAPRLLPLRWLVGLMLAWGAVMAVRCLRRRREREALVALMAVCAAFFFLANAVFPLFDGRSTKSFAAVLKPVLRPSDEVYVVNDYTQDLPVYLGRFVTVVNYKGELEYGINAAEPGKTASRFIAVPEFLARWKAQAPGAAYAVLRTGDEKRILGGAKLPFTVIAQTPPYVLVVNRAPAS